MKEIQLQVGPQRTAALSEATVILYGGGAGSGKSFWLTLDSAKWFDHPGYGAVIFRRTFGELKGTGSLWEETSKIYPVLGGVPRESDMVWKFQPSCATVQLSHLQHDKDALKWRGKNLPAIGLDEAQTFTEQQFWELFSRLRSMSGIRPRMRMTCNPDPDSWLVQFVEWYIDEAGLPRPERSGLVRWFGRKDGKLVWYDDAVHAVADGVTDPTSFTFISARVWDNPALLAADPDYIAKLKALPPVEQARLLGGNWRVRAESGDYFQEQWFPRLQHGAVARRAHAQPHDREIARWWWSVDLASTPVDGDQVPGAPRETHAILKRDADWSIFLLWCEFKNGLLCVWDRFGYRDTPGAIEYALVRHVKKGPKGAPVVLWQDPAQAGVHQIASYTKALRGTARLITTITMDPLDVAGFASRAAYDGRIAVRERAAGADEMFRQLRAFPNKKVHDDDVSALGLGVIYAAEAPRPAHFGAERPPGLGYERARNDVKTTSRFREMR